MDAGYVGSRLLLWAVLFTTLSAIAPWANGEEFEAVSSKVSKDYIRKKTSDGELVPESYAFAKGGYWSGPIFDRSIDKVDFMDIARTIAIPLANQGYLPTAEAKTTNLLLVVYWGTTFVPDSSNQSNAYIQAEKDAQVEHDSYQRALDAARANGGGLGNTTSNAEAAEAKLVAAVDADALSASLGIIQVGNRTRDQANMRNAQMLGYDSEWNEVMSGLTGPAQNFKRLTMITELEEERYFVVVMAYDYQLLVSKKKHKLLWETRFSIRQRNHAFNQQLMAMTVQASKFFGQYSNGVIRHALPAGAVEIGKVQSLGFVGQDEAKAVAPSKAK